MAYKVIKGKVVKVKKKNMFYRSRDYDVQPAHVTPHIEDALAASYYGAKPDPSLKGVFGGNCNRTHCQRPGATWYNTSTRSYYCPACAEMLNTDNAVDALTWSGYDLCIPVGTPFEGYTLEGDMLEQAQDRLARRIYWKFGNRTVELLSKRADELDDSARLHFLACIERVKKIIAEKELQQFEAKASKEDEVAKWMTTLAGTMQALGVQPPTIDLDRVCVEPPEPKDITPRAPLIAFDLPILSPSAVGCGISTSRNGEVSLVDPDSPSVTGSVVSAPSFPFASGVAEQELARTIRITQLPTRVSPTMTDTIEQMNKGMVDALSVPEAFMVSEELKPRTVDYLSILAPKSILSETSVTPAELEAKAKEFTVYIPKQRKTGMSEAFSLPYGQSPYAEVTVDNPQDLRGRGFGFSGVLVSDHTFVPTSEGAATPRPRGMTSCIYQVDELGSTPASVEDSNKKDEPKDE